LGSLRARWQRDDPARGGAFAYYLDNFFGQLQSENTRRAYCFAVLEFWDWYEIVHPGSSPTPDRIERRDAIAFSDWLATRQFGLDEVRLKKDPAPRSRLEAAIYAIVKSRGSAHIADVRGSLLRIPEFTGTSFPASTVLIEASDPLGLDKLLACMVEKKLLVREPSVEELRRRDPTLQNRLRERIDPDLFTYQIDLHTKARGAAERASTIAARLTALSALWTYLIEQTGENTGQKPLLSVNVWTSALHQMLGIATSHRAVASAAKTPDVALFQRLLDTTGGGPPLQAQPLEDVRDRALLLFMFYTGVRADEVGHLRRVDVARDVVTVVGKGRRTRAFRVPEPARRAVDELTSKIAMLASDAERRHPGMVPRMARLLQDEAPLFPAVARWGCNAYSVHRAEEPGLSRQAIAMMMRRRGVAAGIAPGSPDFAKLHPHGLRHLAAKSAIATGTPVHVVQAVLGHKSLATTGIYLEERDPRKLSLFQEAAVAPDAGPVHLRIPREPPQPLVVERGQPEIFQEVVEVSRAPVERPRPRPVVIETVGVPVAAPIVAMPVAVYTPAAAPPPAPPGEGLVAIGALRPLGQPLPSTLEIEAVEAQQAQKMAQARATLDPVYEADAWGEGGREDRQKLRDGKPTSDADKLTHTYVGKRTGLVWWDGPTGNLRPQMPVAAPIQLRPDGPLHEALAALWTERVTGTDPRHPPSSALALLKWLAEALDVTEQVDALREQRAGKWVYYHAPLEYTRLQRGEKARIFRLHPEPKLALWFRVRSGTYMTATGQVGAGRQGQVLDKGPVRPEDAPLDWYAETSYAPEPWYAEEDPVAVLPDAERAALLDWLLALTHQTPIDLVARFSLSPIAPAVSRRDLGTLLGLFCAYDAIRDQRAVERLHTARDPELRSLSLAKFDKSMKAAAQAIDEKVAALQGPTLKPFHYEQAVFQRISERKGAAPAEEAPDVAGGVVPEAEQEKQESKRRSRSHAYLKVLTKLFGKDVHEDPALRVLSYCGQHVLGSLDTGSAYATPFFTGKKQLDSSSAYADFFRVDPEARTIVHSDAYKDMFTQQTGADSECVARRVARHLWEQKHQAKRYERHHGELLWQLNTWAFYKVPCAKAQEDGLAERLKRLGVDSAAALLALLRRLAGKEREAAPEREAYAEGETPEGTRSGEEWRKAEEAEPAEREAEPEPGAESETEEARGSEFAQGGYQQVALGAGAKKPGFVQAWRPPAGTVKSTHEKGGIGGAVKVLRPEQVRAQAEAAAQAEKERAAKAATLGAAAARIPLKPPPKLGTRRIPEPPAAARIVEVDEGESEEQAEAEALAEREAQMELARETRRAALHARKMTEGEEYEPNARDTMDVYFRNARALVPGPVTLLLWIYT